MYAARKYTPSAMWDNFFFFFCISFGPSGAIQCMDTFQLLLQHLTNSSLEEPTNLPSNFLLAPPPTNLERKNA